MHAHPGMIPSLCLCPQEQGQTDEVNIHKGDFIIKVTRTEPNLEFCREGKPDGCKRERKGLKQEVTKGTAALCLLTLRMPFLWLNNLEAELGSASEAGA